MLDTTHVEQEKQLQLATLGKQAELGPPRSLHDHNQFNPYVFHAGNVVGKIYFDHPPRKIKILSSYLWTKIRPHRW